MRDDYLHKEGCYQHGLPVRRLPRSSQNISATPQTGHVHLVYGLSGAGKSNDSKCPDFVLLEHGRQVTLLDGDVVRTHLSKV